MEFGASFGLPMGVVIGLVFALPGYYIVRRTLFPNGLYWALGGTLLGGFPFAFIPEYGPVLCMGGGVLGYWGALIACIIIDLWPKANPGESTKVVPD